MSLVVAAAERPAKLPSALRAIVRRAIVRDGLIEVVDRDRSAASRSFVDAICSASRIKATMRSCELCEAEAAVRSGEAVAAVYIPENLERDIVRGRLPHVTVFFNKQFFTARKMTSSPIRAAVSAATADLEASLHGRAFAPGPLVVEQYVAPNPMVDYAHLSNVIADPIVQTGMVAAIGALVTRILLRGRPTLRLVGQLAFFLALTALLLYHGILPYAVGPADISTLERVFLGIVKVIWWVNAAWSLIGVVRVFLILEQKPREGRLLQDLVVGIIYVAAVLSIIAYVFNAPVGTLIATSGAVAIVLGLALQSTLGDVFSGIALNLAKPYGIGDWLVLSNGIEGKVVETNWRATHLLTGANDLVVVPNSDLAKARLTNLSSPERSHGVTLTVRFRSSTAPSTMADVMRAVLLSSNSILAQPEPSVQIVSLDGGAVELELDFRVADRALAGKAKSEIFDLVFRHAKAAGLSLAAPLGSAGPQFPDPNEVEMPFGFHTTPRRLLDAIPLFASLTEDEKEALASTMTRRTFRKGETLAEQGEVLKSLMIVRSGVVTVNRRDGASEMVLGRLAPGDCLGEGGLLTEAGELGSVKALTLVVVYEITQEGLAPLLRDRPAIADELALLLAKRNASEQLRLGRGDGANAASTIPPLRARIRQLFKL
ncbi:cyclic nucleotide-binding domain-containing protein [Mesorhizobium neociceri]|nr:cyclic nucleotide-binding domain-containing protein [Mesorhizobium neociceri]